MKSYQYTVKLLSDVVITAVTATEGFNPSLDYIPGSKFLGICAKSLYKEDNLATLDVFHNGKVRFGDALPFIEDEIALPVPFSWHTPKGNKLTEAPIYVSNVMKPDDYRAVTTKGIQMKQARKGYFTPVKHYFVNLDQHFIIRSAFDIQQLRSKDSQMYGYYSLPQGSVWSFIVEDETGLYAEKIKETLSGIHRIGRSKSAEYGLVEIAFVKECDTTPPKQVINPEHAFLYAQTNLCFYNVYGRPTLQPEPEQLGFPGAQIDWNSSQIRHRIYQLWNTKRHNRDADRIIIEKGSVIVLQNIMPERINWALLNRGIGSHLAEGFGKVILNPDFITPDQYILDYCLSKPRTVPKQPLLSKPNATDQLMLNYLDQIQIRSGTDRLMDNAINVFLRENKPKFKGISESQWGMIRAYAKQAKDWNHLYDLLFNTNGALCRGKSEAVWRKDRRREILGHFISTTQGLEDNDRILMTIKLASEMAKFKHQ
jgi:hypothetical protein